MLHFWWREEEAGYQRVFTARNRTGSVYNYCRKWLTVAVGFKFAVAVMDSCSCALEAIGSSDSSRSN